MVSRKPAGIWPQVKQRCRPRTVAFNASPILQRLHAQAPHCQDSDWGLRLLNRRDGSEREDTNSVARRGECITSQPNSTVEIWAPEQDRHRHHPDLDKSSPLLCGDLGPALQSSSTSSQPLPILCF